MDYKKELEGKRIHDCPMRVEPLISQLELTRTVTVSGPVIVGAGPSGLATAACLKERGIPSLILERADCLASLWQLKTYDRLRLHLPKNICQLPHFPFPSNYPTYPDRQQFITYLEQYAKKFNLEPVFNKTVVGAEFDVKCGFWRVTSVGMKMERIEYLCKWLVVATGENAEEVMPQFEGMDEFFGPIFHTSAYKTGYLFRDKKVLVVGCGNSGMEVTLDLCNYNARPSLVVRGSIHVLPLEMLGRSTFEVSMWLLKCLPVRFVDCFILLMSHFILGDTAQLGINRPNLGPLQLKIKTGKTPVLDVGTIAKIREGKVKVVRGIKKIAYQAVEFVDGTVERFDAIILATGYRSNVPTWLKGSSMFSEKDGFPIKAFPNGWKGQNGIYAAGFTKRGLHGTSMDATKIADDIYHQFTTINHLDLDHSTNTSTSSITSMIQPTLRCKYFTHSLPKA